MFVVVLTSDVKDLLNRDSRILTNIIELGIRDKKIHFSAQSLFNKNYFNKDSLNCNV